MARRCWDLKPPKEDQGIVWLEQHGIVMAPSIQVPQKNGLNTRTFSKLIIDRSGVGMGQMILFSFSFFYIQGCQVCYTSAAFGYLNTIRENNPGQDYGNISAHMAPSWWGLKRSELRAKVTCRRWAARDIQSTCLWSWTTDRRKKHKTSGLTTSSGSTGSSVSMESWSKTKTCTRDSDLVWFSELSIGDQNENDDSQRLF